MAVIIAAMIGAFVGFITTYLGAIIKFRNDLRFEYDKELRGKRIATYQELWRLTGLFPEYAKDPAVTVQQLYEHHRKLRMWYFDSGMFLSGKARDAYFNYQEAIAAVLALRTQEPAAALDEKTYESLRRIGSQLRGTMVRDVGTRKDSELQHQEDKKTESGEEAKGRAASAG